MDLQRAFEILEITEGASLSEIKKNYRDLAAIWHPDRHTQNPRLYQKAQERMKQLNAAYDYIHSYLSFKDQADTYTESTASVYDEEITVTCPSCYTKNRIRAFDQIEIIIRCGSCGFVLYGDEYASSGEYSDERILCGDGECIGIIGSNGRCTTCGKTFEEGKRADEHKTEREEQARRQYSKKAKRQRNRKILFSSYRVKRSARAIRMHWFATI
jgi:ribosomal protein S27E